MNETKGLAWDFRSISIPAEPMVITPERNRKKGNRLTFDDPVLDYSFVCRQGRMTING